MAFHRLKKNKIWIIKALDRSTGRTVAWVTGGRDAATFRKLYDQVKHLNKCVFYTDHWDAFSKVLPAGRHIIGKEHTIGIEQDNSNTRHCLARMTRRTKVVSKSEYMVNASIKLWLAMTEPETFERFQMQFLSIFG